MIALADDVALVIDSAWPTADSVAVVAGEFAAIGACDSAWVWLSSIVDRNEFVDAGNCSTRTEITVTYRLDFCYPEDGDDPTTTEHEALAASVYDTITDVWCALVSAKDAGTLSDECDRVRLGPLRFFQRSGLIVSYSGTVTADFDCIPTS